MSSGGRTRSLRIGVDARPASETPAGRGRYVRELLRHFARIDTEHEFILYTRSPWECSDLTEQFRWRTVAAPHPWWPIPAGRRAARECDVMLCPASYLLTATASIPTVAVVYDLVPFDRSISSPLGSVGERLTLPIAVRRATTLMAISLATREELVGRFPRAAAKAHVVHPGVDESFRAEGSDPSATLRRYGLEQPYVLVTGTLEPRKNLPRLVEAFEGMPQPLRDRYELVIVGLRGWDAGATVTALDRLGDRARVLGHVPDADLPDLYRAATLFCYPSLKEGFGLPVLEALACRTAVITSRLSSMPEVGGDAASYVDPHDVGDIRAALVDLLSDEQKRSALAARGPAQAARFTWERTAERTLELVEAAAR